MSDISIAEAKQLRDKLEKDISTLVQEYHTKTGVAINGIHVWHIEYNSPHENNKIVIDHNVKVDTKL